MNRALPLGVILCWMVIGSIKAAEEEGSFDLAQWLARPALWETTPDTLPTKDFRWLSAQKRTAQLPHDAAVTLAGLEVGEVIVRFQDVSITGIDVSLFARGDDPPVSRDAFKKMVTTAQQWLTAHTGQEPTEKPGRAEIAAAFRQVWQTPESSYQLNYSFERERRSRGEAFKGEFIRLHLNPVRESPSIQRSAEWLKEQVRQELTGEVWISGVPMIDQGDKGYCVVVAIERVLRYYGMNVSQHELAQLANSHRDEGTSLSVMVDALRGAARVLDVRVRERYSLFGSRSLKQLVDRYNRLARREKEPLLGYDADFFSKATPELILATRIKETAFDRFKTDLQAAVSEGMPLLWSVQLGVFPEKESPQAGGGHMRLIIGYHSKDEDIIYTDSWGPGHEKKRMSFEQAFAITLAMSVLEPQQ